MFRGLVGVVVLTFAGCSGAPPEPQTGWQSSLACGELATLNAAARDGVVTDEELRTRMRSVYDRAQFDNVPDLAQASADAVKTLNTGASLSSPQVERLIRACSVTR